MTAPIFVFGQHARLALSMKLLIETELSIQAIAEECGYPEQSNFSVALKRNMVSGPEHGGGNPYCCKFKR
jgi:AraC-like DNA-binding protein